VYFFGSIWSLVLQWLGIHSDLPMNLFDQLNMFGNLRVFPKKDLFLHSLELDGLHLGYLEGNLRACGLT